MGGKGSGRKPHEPTEETRKIVKINAATGMKHELIAEIIGVSDNTLRDHYRTELDYGLAIVRAEIMAKIYDKAMDGSVSALKYLDDRLPQIIEVDMNRRDLPEDDKPEKVAKLGKKELAQQEAETAGLGTEWGEDLHIQPSTED